MRKRALGALFLGGLAAAGIIGWAGPYAGQMGAVQEFFAATLAEDEAAFVFLGYSAVLVRTAQGAIVVDPAMLLQKEDMDLFRVKKIDAVLYTHAHGDHFDVDTAALLFKATGAPVGAEGAVLQALRRGGVLPSDKIIDLGGLRPRTMGGAGVTPVRGSHVGPTILFHVTLGKIGVFHGGDSAAVPLGGRAAGLAFLPAGDPSPTASPDDALKMALELKPGVIVAFHGSDEQAEELRKKVKASLPGTEVIVPQTLKLYRVKVGETPK